ncbi:hypothetical protein PIB30_068672 [Stylosanthes scabra]|uniref:Uncharacterized protein n=1 Tax=Stylosanthes scabra TaxID=79078 RepID=A0ABU6UMD5_9FABA|nr:hypothetical protein [Stylosanthes scabra]
MHIMQGRAHRLASPPPLRPRGPRSHRPLPPRRRRSWTSYICQVTVVTGVHAAWWDSSISSTRAGWIMGGPIHAPATVPTPPASPAPAEQPDEPATCWRASEFHVAEAADNLSFEKC